MKWGLGWSLMLITRNSKLSPTSRHHKMQNPATELGFCLFFQSLQSQKLQKKKIAKNIKKFIKKKERKEGKEKEKENSEKTLCIRP